MHGEVAPYTFLPISHIICTSRCTDLFVEVTNITKGNGIWAHFVSTRYFPSQIQLSRPIQKDDVQIETFCCIFKHIIINWSSINITGIPGTMITMPDMAYVSIFTDNDLTHITEDHFEIKLIARLLDQIYVVQPPMFPPRYDDAPPQEYEYSQPHEYRWHKTISTSVPRTFAFATYPFISTGYGYMTRIYYIHKIHVRYVIMIDDVL